MLPLLLDGSERLFCLKLFVENGVDLGVIYNAPRGHFRYMRAVEELFDLACYSDQTQIGL